MQQLKKFTKNGNRYVMKRQYGFGLIIVFGMAAFSVGGFWMHNTAVGWIFGILTVLCFISIWYQDVIIDMDKKEIITKMGLINKPVHIPLADFINFELVRVSHNFIQTNVCLNLYYRKDGKEKCADIAQAFTSRAIQNLINEFEEIIHTDEHSRKI